MADLLIRGGKLPKYGCAYCFLRTGNYCGELSTDESVVPYSRKFERHPDCPLVEIPDHGRLGDLDEMAIDESEAYMSAQVKLGDDVITKSINEAVHAKMVRLIADTPTIIPASPADRSNTSDESPQIQIVADALKHGFYGTMYGEKYAQGVKLVFIEPGKAWASNGDLFFRWGYPGPDVNTYKPEDCGKTWALTEAELTESIQPDPADKEGGA